MSRIDREITLPSLVNRGLVIVLCRETSVTEAVELSLSQPWSVEVAESLDAGAGHASEVSAEGARSVA